MSNFSAKVGDRLLHRYHIFFEMNSESYRFRESMKGKRLGESGPRRPAKSDLPSNASDAIDS
ncbi:MAG: hypothetical protein CMJ64_27165 [Planctomycetaceae bacterium]|nr:hypothetical protein [Planctomycetaceae bacterium]